MKLVVLFVVTGAFSSCAATTLIDIKPPKLVGQGVDAKAGELSLEFDETLAKAVIEGPVTGAIRIRKDTASAALRSDLIPGDDYPWTASVEDSRGNRTELAGHVFGPNSHPADLRLNEVRVAGSGAKPDFVEILVTESGNWGGWTLEFGGANASTQKVVLPDEEVQAGTYLVVVIASTAGSRPTEIAPEARVTQPPHLKGLSATTGGVSLGRAPDSAPEEALIWEKSEGAAKAWLAKLGECHRVIVPSLGATTTRTWCRGRADDWYLATTGGATPGRVNSSERWVPKPSSP